MKKAKLLVFLLAAFMTLSFAMTGCRGGGTSTNETPEAKKPWEDGKTYTYRMAPSDLPTAWNLHTYESNSSTYVLDYSSDALYTFDYNDDYTGFQIVPSMAAADPVDVTADYVGKYGVTEADAEEGGKVYKIAIKEGLKFDNGADLDANSFVESMKLLLAPEAANFRADNVYQSGQLKIHNAENYVKQGQTVDEDNYDTAKIASKADLTKGADGAYYYQEGQPLKFAIGATCSYLGTALKNYAPYLEQTAFAELLTYCDEDGFAPVTDETWELLKTAIYTANWGWEDETCVPFYMQYTYEYKSLDFSEVGFFAPSSHELVVVLKNPMALNFWLRRELCTSFFLVYAPLYKECISSNQGVYTNNYGTSLDTYVGYGPYKLTTYVQDSEIKLERNMQWHGYADGTYVEGTYMTDAVSFKKVNDEATRLEMFLKGEIDSYGLQPADMEDYLGSKYTYFTDTESTWYLAMNPDYDTLSGIQAKATPETAGNEVNKTVLCLQEFRQALSYSVNRAEFNATFSPSSGIAKALLSSMIVADPESGLSYRATEEGKDAILEFWGLSDAWGEGKEYATKDEAIESITGFDPAGAKDLFTAAYNKAVEEGYISAAAAESGKWEVQIVIGIPVIANYYTKGAEWFANTWKEAVKGTPFEGHLVVTPSQELGSTSFGSYLREGKVDVLFGVGYGGDMFNPYSMMDCFTGSLQYDPFTDKDDIDLDVEIDGKTLRASLYAWVSECLQGDTIIATVIGEDGEPTKETVEIEAGSNAEGALRVQILAAAEAKILTIANIFPLQTDASASMRCMRVNFKSKEYVLGMGFGGIQYYTYAMDDAEFLAYAASCEGGILNYKAS